MKVILFLVITTCIFMQDAATQNIGVGTTSPIEKLHVAGNIKADTVKPAAIKFLPNAGNGKIMMSDAVGNASWQNPVVNSGGSGGAGFGSWGDCLANANLSGYNPVSHPDPKSTDLFGRAVAIDGEFAVVGALSDDVNGISNQGSVSVFRFDGTRWNFFQLLSDPAGIEGDGFGSSVSISGNFMVIGVPSADITAIDQGAASVFFFDGSTWVFQQQLSDPDGSTDDDYGRSVCISGNTIIVGAPGDAVAFPEQGSASIFQYDGTNWIFLQQLTDPGAADGDFFGRSVGLSGDDIIVGVPFANIGINANQGKICFYRFDAVTWNYLTALTDVNGAGGDEFGHSVSISGVYSVGGARSDDVSVSNQGSAQVYYNNNGTWEQKWSIYDPVGATNDRLGWSVSISGNFIIVGANEDDVSFSNQGSAIIYQRVGLGWQKLQQVVDPGGTTSSELGYSVAIDASTGRFILGAPGFVTNSGRAVLGKIN